MLKTALIIFSCLIFCGSGRPYGSHYGTETKCQRELRIVTERMNRVPPVIGARIPVCDSNGNYVPKQCSGSQCYCVTKNGTVIEGYNVYVWEADDQTCKCARDFQEYREIGLIGKLFRCSNNGNYEPVQCSGSRCYCVDEDGRRIGTDEVNIWETHLLQCER